ncbi:MAG TPA: DinB family protein [Terriglobales bacterium]|nr:DinB family protein [Terriglobales bacterium]
MISETANPYAKFLAGRDAVEVIAATPNRLSDLTKKLGPKGLERSLAPGKWPARGILCHLADCELVFAFRLRQTLAQPNHVMQPFDQDDWARTYSNYTADNALEVFSSVRRWNLALLKKLPESAMAKTASHPERGQMTFKTILETMAGHDTNHIQQLEKIAGQPD